MSTTTPEPISTRRKTALAIIKAYEDWSIDAIMALRTEDCISTIIPSSLGHTPMTNSLYLKMWSIISTKVSNFRITIHDIIEDEKGNKIVMYATSLGDTERGRGTYGQEYMLVFEFEDGGERIRKMTEFVDSKRSEELFDVLWGEQGVRGVREE